MALLGMLPLRNPSTDRNVNGLCFFILIYFLKLLVRSLAPLGVKPLDRF